MSVHFYHWLGASANAEPGSREPSPATRSRPVGFDPARVWDQIKHGDTAHRDWLWEALHNIANGVPVPPPRGGGLNA